MKTPGWDVHPDYWRRSVALRAALISLGGKRLTELAALLDDYFFKSIAILRAMRLTDPA